ncbi:MAG TPA: hypothetical protein VHQ39_08885 [Dongiaceae bacterium]|nr:hypothetical protein [Dongiaceae bacterium]
MSIFGAAALLAAVVIAAPALADFQKGLDAYTNGDYAAALKEWKSPADQGDAHAQYGLGLLFDLGRGVPADPAQAAKWYSLAAAQELPGAQSNLAMLYAEGRGVPKDMSRADQLWLSAGKSGVVEAQFNLGLSYYRGEGVPKSYPDAAGWFQKAAEGGSVDGQYAIAEMYRIGRGVPKNIPQARLWFTKAAKAGNAAAADRLANLPPDSGGSGAVALGPAATPPATTVPAPTLPATTPPATTASATGESVNSAAPLTPVTKTPSAGTAAASGTIDTASSGSGQLASVPAVTTPLPAAIPDTTAQPPATSATTIAPAPQPAGSSNIVTFESSGGTTVTSAAPAAGAALAPAMNSTDTGATTTVLTASGLPQPSDGGTMVTTTAGGLAEGSVTGGSRNGQIPPAGATPPGMLVPTNSDVAPTTKVQIQTGATTADTGPPVIPPAKSAGAINLGLPIGGGTGGTVAPAPAPDVNVASIPADTATTGGSDVYRVWIGTFKTENDALIYWGQELQRFPDLLKQLKLVIRQVDLGASQGIWYRVLGGPFGSRESADNLCGAIKSRSPLDECRVILN